VPPSYRIDGVCIYLITSSELCHVRHKVVFIIELKSTYSAVRAGSLNKAVCTSSLRVNAAFPMQIPTIKADSNCSCHLCLTLRRIQFISLFTRTGGSCLGTFRAVQFCCFPAINVSLTTSISSFFRFLFLHL
jgi:hypothetical protein